MVRALREGRKTVTRRVVKPQPTGPNPPGQTYDFRNKRGQWIGALDAVTGQNSVSDQCPYGAPGDRLYVREAWQYADWTEDDGIPLIRYRADGAERWARSIPDEWQDRVMDTWATLSEPSNYDIDGRAADRRWRPGIHQPRWAARLTLDVVSVAVERVQDITESDALAEGVGSDTYSLRGDFARLWNSLNASRGYGWDSNPYVWRVEFRVVSPTS